MAASENERPNVTTMLVQNTNDVSDDEEMSDATDEKDEDHKRAGVSPIHVPADWEKTDSTGNADSESLERRQERAKRFGCSSPEKTSSMDDINLDSLYKSLGVSTKSEERLRVEGIREEAIHIRGIDNMNTQEVFRYFQEFSPASVEWINDSTCNVVWLDNMTTTRALVQLSYDVEHVPDFSEGDREPSRPRTSKPQAQEERMETDLAGPVDGTGRNQRRRNRSNDDLLSSDESDSGNESTSREDSDADEETGEAHREPDEETGEKKRKSRDGNRGTAVGGMSVNGTASSVGGAAEGGTAADNAARKQTDHGERMDTEAGDGPKVRSFRCGGKDIPLPRGRWRVGVPIHKGKYLFLRFATKADVKPLGARVQSRYTMAQDNPRYSGVAGLTSESRKRKLRAFQWKLDEEGEIGMRETPEEGFDARDEILDRIEVRSSAARVPGQTSMDRHIKAAETERVRLHKNRLCSDEEAEAEAELAVLLSSSSDTVVRPPPKRKMRMYADDLEERKKSKSATVIARVATTLDARSKIESRRRGKQLGLDRLPRTQDDLDLDKDSLARRTADHRGQHQDLRDRLGRRKDNFDTGRSSYGDRLGRRKDEFGEGRLKYEKLTIEVQQD